jgi:transposase InsO family protein
MKCANPPWTVDLSWLFTIWGINIVGVLPKAPGGFRFSFIAIDIFTKWMEAMPVENITQDASVKFLQSIIYRFGAPNWVLTGNGTQFKRAKFGRCYADFGINLQDSSVAHPQTNGQVQHANELILQGMKARMFHDLEAKGRNLHKDVP